MKKHFDLIVVGAGILGTFHAYHALHLGLNVLLLEKDSRPRGATVRNFGQIIPSGMTGKWVEFGMKGLEVYREIQRKFDITVRENGSVYIASDTDEMQLLHELKAHHDTTGYACELVSKEAIHKKYPALRTTYAREALYFPQELSVEPETMIQRVHTYMKLRFPNLTLSYNAPVIACTEGSAGVEVTVSGIQKWVSEKAIICSGSEVKLLFPEVFSNKEQQVCKLQMMRTIPLVDEQLEGNILTGLSIRRYESFQEYCPSFKKIKVPDHYNVLQKQGIHILIKKAIDGSFTIGDSHQYVGANEIDNLGYELDEQVNKLIISEASRVVSFDVHRVASKWAGYYLQSNQKGITEESVTKNIFIRTGIGGKGMTSGIGYAASSLKAILG